MDEGGKGRLLDIPKDTQEALGVQAGFRRSPGQPKTKLRLRHQLDMKPRGYKV